jgi:hypothetical protein
VATPATRSTTWVVRTPVVVARATTWHVVSPTSLYDPATEAYLASTGLDQSYAPALDGLVVGLKTKGLWSKMAAIYPFIGGTADLHKWNLKDPRDLDAAYRLTFTAGTHTTALGYRANPVGQTMNAAGRADTHFIPSAALSDVDSTHLAFYSLADQAPADRCDMGCYNWDGPGSRFHVIAFYTSGEYYYGMSEDGITSCPGNGTSSGLFVSTRTAGNFQAGYRNGVVNGSSAAPSSKGLPPVSVHIGAINYYQQGPSDLPCGFASIGAGLGVQENADLYEVVQGYQTALGRATGAVLTPVSASRSTTWTTAATVGASRGSTWAVLTKVAPVSRSTTWNALTAVASSTRSTTWAARALVAPTTRSTTWRALSSVTGTRQTTWQALAAVAPVTRPTLWNAQGQVTMSRQASWNTAGALLFVSASRSTTWVTRATITPTRSTTWDVLSRVFPAITRLTTWSVLTPVTPTTRSTTWYVRVQVTLSRQTTWNVAGALFFIGASRSTAWVVGTTTSTSRATAWRALYQVPVMRAATWSVCTTAISLRPTTWRVQESVVTARVTTWRAASRTIALRSTTWHVRPAAAILHYLTLYPNTVLYHGGHQVHAIYQGSTKVWP